MKKFMKAIAFATVMCMLLSTAAFANGPATATDIADGKVTVTVTDANAKGEQLALIATKATVETAADIDNTNILDIRQVALSAEAGTVATELGTKGETSVKIFYGYQSAGVDSAQFVAAGVAQVGATVQIINAEIYSSERIADESAENNYVLSETDTDNAGAIIAKVLLNNPAGKTVEGVIWSIRHNGAKQVAYVTSTLAGFGVLDGETEIALAFSNGNRSEGDAAIAEVEVTGLHAIVILSDAEGAEEIIYSDSSNFDSSRKENK